MDKQEITEMLDSIGRLKNNIAECDSIIKILREVQVNYENAVQKPSEILDKIEKLSQLLNAEISNNVEKMDKSSVLLKNECKALFDSCSDLIKNEQKLFVEKITELNSVVENDYNRFIGECKKLADELEERKKSFTDEVDKYKQKIADMEKAVKFNKKVSFINVILSGSSIILCIIILILLIIK